MPASLSANELLPATAQDYVRQFDERFIALRIATEPLPWVKEIVDLFDVSSPLTRFPVNMMALQYIETRDGNRDQDFEDRYFDLKVVEFDAGVEASLLELNAFPYKRRQWDSAPQRFLTAEMRHVSKACAALLEAGTTSVGEDGEAFFSTAHPVASGATFSNYQTTPLAVASIANLEAEITAMRQQVRDENGDLFPASPDVIMVPTGKAIGLQNLLNQQYIPSAAGTASMVNPYFQGLRVIENPDLTDANDWYLIDTKLMNGQGFKPMVAAKYDPGRPLSYREFDETSDFFKSKGKIKVSSHLWYGFGLAFPHAIRRVVGA
ncbi:MAG: hypothetical protein H0U46_03010 [Actinobacteria bacterium]|nr:hypothetical protein [Actinomycetota bacterium]